MCNNPDVWEEFRENLTPEYLLYYFRVHYDHKPGCFRENGGMSTASCHIYFKMTLLLTNRSNNYIVPLLYWGT